MLGTDDLENKNLEKETERIAARKQLKQYGSFFEKNNQILSNLEDEAVQNTLLVNVMFNMIELNFEAWEDRTVLQLVQSDNRIFSKVLASLASICEEANVLVNEGKTKYYHELLFYGKDLENGKIDLNNLGKLLSLLQDLCSSIKHARILIELILQQLVAISGKERQISLSTPYISFVDLCESLGDLLVYIQTIECLLNNPLIHNGWNAYKRASRTAQHSQRTFQFPIEQLRAFDKLLIQIENILLSEKIFQHTIESCLEKRHVLIGKNTAIGDELNTYMMNIIVRLEKDDTRNLDRTIDWLRINMLIVFNFHLFGHADKKIIKHLLEYNKKVCACTLVGNLLWYPEQFLARHIPTQLQFFDERFVQATVVQRQAHLTQRSQSLLRDTLSFCQQACLWILQLEKIVQEDTSQMQFSDLQQRCKLFLQGLLLARDISDTVKWITNIHAADGKPINRTTFMCIFRLNSLLKGLLCAFKQHFVQINLCVNLVVQYLQFQVLSIIRNIKKSMTQDKSYKDQNLDVLAALRIADQSLRGPATERRLLVARLAMSATLPVADRAYIQVRQKLDHIQVFVNLNSKLTELCDLSFLYWHQILLHAYFQRIFEYKVDMSKVMYTFYGLNDCLKPLSDEDAEVFAKSMETSVNEKVISPLCQAIEVNLRLQTHAHLHVETPSPFDAPLVRFRSLLNMAPLKLYDHFICIKSHTENYLSTTFYNLATVVLHDWHTYGEMRRLAYFKYELETIQDFLPNQTLEQGLDVLEIMRNIHVFVSKYLYNLNNQIFVEQCSNNKHLNTINIRHIANSIRMHGIGIMNTTVNFTYQFLRKKFDIFSQFLFDEHIKSRLIKDIRYFRDNKTVLEQMYPFERADKFNRSIRKLGVTPTGDTFLDLFRSLISQIGNAMGYIRMIRSGGRHFCASAVSFLPSLEENNEFHLENSSVTTAECSQQLIKQIDILSQHFDEKTEYFKLLVEVFAEVFRNPTNMHLRNFYAIVPPLTVNFVEHSLKCRELLNKKNKVGAAFTDDGFAMGMAYILQLLQQDSELSSLHWFQSVRQKYGQDCHVVAQQRVGADKDDTKLLQTLALTEKRILSYQQEFDLLYYNLNSATIFFR